MSTDRYNELFVDTVNNNFNFDEEDIAAEIVLLNSGGISCKENKESKLCCECEKNVFNTYTLSFNCSHVYHRNCLLRQIIDDEISECQLCVDIKNNKTCALCMEKPDTDEEIDCEKCKNIFHRQCVLEWAEQDKDELCPVCELNNIHKKDINNNNNDNSDTIDTIDTIWGPTNIKEYAQEA